MGLLEFQDNKMRGGAFSLALVLRWWLGSGFWMFVKLIGLEVLALALAHFFFVVVSAVVKELLDQKLRGYGESFRKLMAEEAKKDR